MDTMLFVYNRHAGKDRTWAEFSHVLNILTEKGYLVTAYPTQAPGDAGEAITRWGANYDRILVAGGDGTLSDGVSGLLRLSDPPPLGYIPLGSTNDFSRNLSLPSDLLAMAGVAAEGVEKPCDVGTLNGRPFIYVAAFGVFAEVSFNTPQASKNILGYTAYLLEGIKRLPSVRPIAIEAEIDGVLVSGQFICGMVTNTGSVAGLAHFPPGNPVLDDGLFEVTFISPPKDILELEQLGRKVLLGQDSLESPMIHSYTGSRITIRCEEELLWTLDGENGGYHKTSEIVVQPKAFTIIHGA